MGYLAGVVGDDEIDGKSQSYGRSDDGSEANDRNPS
jgi:hypothetical protein